MSFRWEMEQLAVRDSDPETLTALRLHGTFPLEGESRRQLTALLPRLQQELQKRLRLPIRRSLFLQMTQLPRPGGATSLSQNASEWMPGLAIGVSADGEPPRSMRKEDFTHRQPGTPFPAPQGEGRQILATEESELTSVEEALGGSGALLEIFAQEGWVKRDGVAVSHWLRSRITDDSYRTLPFYFPLLDAAALGRISAPFRESCLAGVELYLREDVADRCVLLVTRLPFESTMELLDKATRATARVARTGGAPGRPQIVR